MLFNLIRDPNSEVQIELSITTILCLCNGCFGLYMNCRMLQYRVCLTPDLKRSCTQYPSSFILSHVSCCYSRLVARLSLLFKNFCCILIHCVTLSIHFCFLHTNTEHSRCSLSLGKQHQVKGSCSVLRRCSMHRQAAGTCIIFSGEALCQRQLRRESPTNSASSGSSYISSILNSSKIVNCWWLSRWPGCVQDIEKSSSDHHI